MREHLNNRSRGQCNQPVRGNDGIDRSRVRFQDRKLEDEYWIFHETKEYKGNHRTLYTDGIVPPTIKLRPTRKHNHLKAICICY